MTFFGNYDEKDGVNTGDDSSLTRWHNPSICNFSTCRVIGANSDKGCLKSGFFYVANLIIQMNYKMGTLYLDILVDRKAS